MRVLVLGSLVAAISGCGSGYEFTKKAEAPKPNDVAALKDRTVLQSANGAYLDNWDRLLGNVLYEVKDGATCEKTKLDPTLTVVALKEKCAPNIVKTPRVLMQGAFAGGVSIGGTYIVGGTNTNVSVAFDATVADIGSAFAPYDSCMPTDIKDDLKPANACRAIWVEGVALTTIATKQYSDAKGDTKLSAYAMNFGGSVYTTNSTVEQNFLITVNTRLLKRYENAPAPPKANPAEAGEHPVISADFLSRLVHDVKGEPASAKLFKVEACAANTIRTEKALAACTTACTTQACRDACNGRAALAQEGGCWKTE